MSDRIRGRWAEIGAFFAGALLSGALVAELMPRASESPEAARPVGLADPVIAEVHVWGWVLPEHIPPGGMRGMVLALEDADMSRVMGAGIRLMPGPMEIKQR